MSVKINSQALSPLPRALRMAQALTGETEFLDELLLQSLDVSAIARRGGCQAGTGGIYACLMQNTHAGADSQISDANPYDIGADVALNDYPDSYQATRDFDIWLLSATLRQSGGSGTLAAGLFYSLPPSSGGWGLDQAGAAVAIPDHINPLAYWDSVVTQTYEFGLRDGKEPFVPLGVRMARDPISKLIFGSTSSAAAVFDCQLVLGVFPASLGQDGIT